MIRVNMFSSATKVKGQGVGSAYTELIRLLKTHLGDEISVAINRYSKADVSHYHTVDFKFFLSTFLPNRGVKVGYVHFLPETLEGSLKLPFPLKQIFNWYLMTFYKRMDRLVVVNPSFIDKLVALGVDKNKVTYIPNFVAKEAFHPLPAEQKLQLRQKFNLPTDKFIVVGVGQIQARKGVFDFIKLAQRMPKIEFVWVGGFSFGKITDGYDELKKVVANPPKNLHFPGIVERSAMNEYYNASDVFLLPSYNELFPMSVLEAFSSGLPVVLRDLALYHCIIADNYVKCDDVNQMQQAIATLKDDKTKYQYWLAQSKKAADYYSEQRLAQVWDEYYHRLVEGDWLWIKSNVLC